jgi:nitrogen fixation-related uncharacterized protein
MSDGGPAWLLPMWIAFMSVVGAGVVAVFVWAVRARQFAGQERARYLALRSGIPGAAGSDKTASGKGGGDVPS